MGKKRKSKSKKHHSSDEYENISIDHIHDDEIEENFDYEMDSDHEAENSNSDESEEESEESEEEKPKKNVKFNKKTKDRLKAKITDWLDSDDKIKELNSRVKKYKDAKKEGEEVILKMLELLGMDESKIDVHDDNNQLRSRVYRHRSVTKSSLKEDTIKDALMEIIKDEKRVDQLVKKIESKRTINERYYLKRTKGSKE
jgi:hypothetical protein